MPSTKPDEVPPGRMVAREGLKAAEEGNIVGREGPRRDVKVLRRLRCLLWILRSLIYLCVDVLDTGSPTIFDTTEPEAWARRLLEQRRHSILINWVTLRRGVEA